MIIIAVLIGFAGGAIFEFLIQKPKIDATYKLDSETAARNEDLKQENLVLLSQRDLIKDQILEAKRNADKVCDQYKEQCNAAVEQSFIEAQEKIKENETKIQELQEELKDNHSIVAAAIEANKRADEMKNKQNFYRLNLSQDDIEEIQQLRETTKHFRNKESINKIIWKIYYEKPCTDMIGRVVGSGTHIGIYKITNIENGMVYVGQSNNIANRFKQHIKRGIGAETPIQNKLYPAMLATGVENFTFEIVEECSIGKLNEREQFWQNYFGAREYGYSIR
jgi:predicted GIY-YIG superfamily endonuclease